MVGTAGTIRVAAVQASPVFLDAGASVARVASLIGEAAAGGAQVVCFGEGAIPAHPVWLHVHPVTSRRSIDLAARLVASAVSIPGPEVDGLCAAAGSASAFVVVGVVERESPGSSRLYSTQLVIGADGTLLGRRRKLVPAVGERVLLAHGDGTSLRTFETPWAPLAALTAGENANPLMTWTMRTFGARIHVAAWPPHFNKGGVMGEVMSITGRAIAYQNTAYVVAVRSASSADQREAVATSDDELERLTAIASEPGSVIYAPRGAILAGPLDAAEGILYADLDMGAVAWPSLVNHHYDRDDLFRVTVDRRPASPAMRSLETPVERTGTSDDPGDIVRARYGADLDPGDVDAVRDHLEAARATAARLREVVAPADQEVYPLDDREP